MTFDLEKMLQSKREMRRELAARSLAEKLTLLDALRERTLALRAAAPPAQVLADENSAHNGLEVPEIL